MRISSLFLCLTLLATLAPATAMAHYDHYPCGYSRTIPNNLVTLVHLDVWTRYCIGAAVAFREDFVVCDGTDIHVLNAHVLFLYDRGCQTGVILEPISITDAAELLP